MNLDSLITVAGLFVAVYAIIPRVRRLEISLRFGRLGWLILFVALASILYLQFYQTFRSLGLTPGYNLSRWSITTSNASFIILLMSLGLYAYLRVKKISKSNVVKFREYVFELSREKKYSELFSLIEGNIAQLERIYNGLFPLSRLQNYLKSQSAEYADLQALLAEIEGTQKQAKPTIRDKVARIFRKKIGFIADLLPSYNREKEVAKEIVHEVLINRNTIKAISKIRPYFAFQMLSSDFYENNEFVDTYLRCLAEDTKSVLYHEIRNNQNLDYRNGYALPKRNRLLYFLFTDCRVAEKFGAYKPVGEFVIAHLDALYSRSAPDPYNEPMGDFHENGQWDSELLVGIRFFDIMITSALYQNIQWHMWLYYFPHFVDRILRNLAPNEKLVDPYAEWPTKYHYALYEITSCLCKWIEAVDRIPLEQDNVVLKSTLANHENGNIPKSSMLALGQIVKQILVSDVVADRFKKYITDMVYRRYFELRKVDATKPYAEALINCIRCGGFSMGQTSPDYTQYLLDAFDDFDRIPYEIDLSDELRQILQDDVSAAVA
ncbi:MAG: hypothetical protein CMG93_04860 [Marinomonas sp.]|nr:hypothetical protein [Marinomonas sp.]